MLRHFQKLCLALSIVILVGCTPKSNEKEVFKITGSVMVDGSPIEGIQISLQDVAGPDTNNPSLTQGTTDAQGNVLISTYAEGDGAPAGEYKVTFVLQEFNLMSRAYSGTDKLNNKYADPDKSTFTLSVGRDKPNDLGKIELTTKK